MYIFSVSYKLVQSPQWPKGLLPATHSSLCSPHALQVSGETLVQRFCVPTTLNSKRIFSAINTYASGQCLLMERLHVDQSADRHCRASPRGNHSRVQLSSSLRPKRYFPPKLQPGSVSSKQGQFPTSCLLHQRSLKLLFQTQPQRELRAITTRPCPSPQIKALSVAQTPLFPTR